MIGRLRNGIVLFLLTICVVIGFGLSNGSASVYAESAAGGTIDPASKASAEAVFGAGNATYDEENQTMTIDVVQDMELTSAVRIEHVFEDMDAAADNKEVYRVIINLNGHTVRGADGESELGLKSDGSNDYRCNGYAAFLLGPNLQVTINGDGTIIGGDGVYGGGNEEAVDPEDIGYGYGGSGIELIGWDWFPTDESYELLASLTLDDGILVQGGIGAGGIKRVPDANVWNCEACHSGRGGDAISTFNKDNSDCTYYTINIQDATVQGGKGADFDTTATDIAGGHIAGAGGAGIRLRLGLNYVSVDAEGYLYGGDGGNIETSHNRNTASANNAGAGGAGLVVNDTMCRSYDMEALEQASIDNSDYFGVNIEGTVRGGNGGDASGTSAHAGAGGAGIFLSDEMQYQRYSYRTGPIHVAGEGSIIAGNGGNAFMGRGGNGGDGIAYDTAFEKLYYTGTLLEGTIRSGNGGNSRCMSASDGGEYGVCGYAVDDTYTLVGSGTLIDGEYGTAYRACYGGSNSFPTRGTYSNLSYYSDWSGRLIENTKDPSASTTSVIQTGSGARMIFNGTIDADNNSLPKKGDTITVQLSGDAATYAQANPNETYYIWNVQGYGNTANIIGGEGSQLTINDEVATYLKNNTNSGNTGRRGSYVTCYVVCGNGITVRAAISFTQSWMIFDSASSDGAVQATYITYNYPGTTAVSSNKITNGSNSGKGATTGDPYKSSGSGNVDPISGEPTEPTTDPVSPGSTDGQMTKITIKGTSISKLTRAKKAFTVKWKKQTAKTKGAHIGGYQVQYALNSKFTKSKKTVTVKKYTSYKKTVKKLKSKKYYYVRVRTYQKISGKTYYSKWSKVKKIKTR